MGLQGVQELRERVGIRGQAVRRAVLGQAATRARQAPVARQGLQGQQELRVRAA